MPRPGDKIHIPLPPDDAVIAFMRVKPTADMPRPGATGKPKKRKRSKASG